MQDDNKDISNFQLFLIFIKADKRCLPQFTKDLKRRIPGKKLDFPLLRYISSLNDRLTMLSFLRDTIHKSNKEAIEEMERIQKNGSGTNEKSLILVVYYESFLNQIYNIMENLAIINLFMFDSKNPPDLFSNQMKNIQNGTLEFHPEYDKLIKTEMDWYKEVHRIRSNTNHYTVGMNIFEQTRDGVWISQYMNFNISDRLLINNIFKMERNILGDTESFYESTIKPLNKISEIYIERIDKEKPCVIPFVGKDVIEFRELSFTEYKSGKIGKLIQFPIQRK